MKEKRSWTLWAVISKDGELIETCYNRADAIYECINQLHQKVKKVRVTEL